MTETNNDVSEQDRNGNDWLPFVGQESCEHERIEIIGMRDDISAIYECEQCGEIVRPSKSDNTYHPV